MNWYKENSVFVWTLIIAICVIVFGAVYSSTLGDIAGKFMSWVSHYFGWLYILSIVAFIAFCVWMAIGKWGNIKLGKEDDKPEFSTFSWLAMLFCGSTGIGLVFWSIAEPLSHYAAPPLGIEPGTMDTIDFSVRTCYLHWGINLYEKMKKLFEETKFTGIFSIEFLRDKDDNLYFLEINFRNSTWSYAHTAEGVNLPVIWAKSVLAGRLVTSDVILKKDRFTAMQEFTDFKDSVIGRQCSLWQWIKDVRDCDCRFYYNKQDNLPFWNILRKKIFRF